MNPQGKETAHTTTTNQGMKEIYSFSQNFTTHTPSGGCLPTTHTHTHTHTHTYASSLRNPNSELLWVEKGRRRKFFFLWFGIDIAFIHSTRRNIQTLNHFHIVNAIKPIHTHSLLAAASKKRRLHFASNPEKQLRCVVVKCYSSSTTARVAGKQARHTQPNVK